MTTYSILGTLTVNGEAQEVILTLRNAFGVTVENVDGDTLTVGWFEHLTREEYGANAVPSLELDIPAPAGEWSGEHTALVAAASVAGWMLTEGSL